MRAGDERRLVALNAARHHGLAAPADVTRPLWILLDHLTELSELAHAEGRGDPQELLEVPLRHGRAARVTVVFVDALDARDRISATVHACARARVVLGRSPSTPARRRSAARWTSRPPRTPRPAAATPGSAPPRRSGSRSRSPSTRWTRTPRPRCGTRWSPCCRTATPAPRRQPRRSPIRSVPGRPRAEPVGARAAATADRSDEGRGAG
ncbi:hypothetical protein [Kitasatospora fiedleri]|uniref:hypothetical protein n=1 Tax=Kitasatospora fiedleri TaxID=2991545 RepID=UPI00249BD66E|nr:hypothetical protein [Kitasatospora fiedleri]